MCLKLLIDVLTAVGTIAVAIIAYVQLSDLSKTAKAELTNKIKNELLTDRCQKIIVLIRNKAIIYDNSTTPHMFNVDKTKINEKVYQRDYTDWFLTTAEMNDYVLQHFEDLGFYLQEHYIDLKFAYLYGDYVETIWENDQIKKYIVECQKEDEDIYSAFEWLYEEIKKFEKTLRSKKN